MKLSFYGGVHPNEHKELTCTKAVEPLRKAPAQVALAMAMHVGAPCAPVVKVGDPVTVGQKIAEVTGLGAPIHGQAVDIVTLLPVLHKGSVRDAAVQQLSGLVVDPAVVGVHIVGKLRLRPVDVQKGKGIARHRSARLLPVVHVVGKSGYLVRRLPVGSDA